MPADNHILSVSALTRAVKGNIEDAFPFVWVRGQVTNVARPVSGHIYFTLRDEEAALTAVWFKGQQTVGERFDPLTGEVYEDGPRTSLAVSLANGQEVICAGRLTVYAPRSNYQLVVELAENAGQGRLQAEFEQLRLKLATLGYFAQERKKTLPPCPRRIVLITSPKGAAIHDFLRIADARGIGAEIRIYPVPVQGDMAPACIAKALRRANADGFAELAVLIRGGGSLEDLHAFNTEQVAQAVFASDLPVLAGIGHEIDFTLADMTADVRAATPTHAAQILWPEKGILLRQVTALEQMLEQAEDRWWEKLEQRLDLLGKRLKWHSPEQRLALWKERLGNLAARLDKNLDAGLRQRYARLSAVTALFEQDPGKRLDLAFLRLQNLEVTLEQRSQAVWERLLAFSEETAARLAGAVQNLPPKATHLQNLTARLHSFSEKHILSAGHSLDTLSLQLEAVNPLTPLERGYALVTRQDGAVVRSIAQAAPGQKLSVTVHDGSITVEVQGVTPHDR